MKDVLVALLHPDAKPPSPAHEGIDAGLDVYAFSQCVVQPGELGVIPTGVSVAIPVGYVGLLVLRSSSVYLGVTMPHGVGIIDPGYRGELTVVVRSQAVSPVQIDAGQRIAQLVVVPQISHCTPRVVDVLPPSLRGIGGFGSTGT